MQSSTKELATSMRPQRLCNMDCLNSSTNTVLMILKFTWKFLLNLHPPWFNGCRSFHRRCECFDYRKNIRRNSLTRLAHCTIDVVTDANHGKHSSVSATEQNQMTFHFSRRSCATEPARKSVASDAIEPARLYSQLCDMIICMISFTM